MNIDTQETTTTLSTDEGNLPQASDASCARAGDVLPYPNAPLGSRRRLAGMTVTKLDLANVNLQLSEALLGAQSPGAVADRLVAIMDDAVTVGRDGSTQPDYRTQLAAIQLFLAYAAGRPIERQQILTANVGTEETEAAVAERIAGSPALKARLRELLKE